jgi:hypothetical protein
MMTTPSEIQNSRVLNNAFMLIVSRAGPVA